MIPLYKLLSVLLEYPTKDLFAHWDNIKYMLAQQDDLSVEDNKRLFHFIDWASGMSLTKLQAEYVNTFDLKADNSLYLTYHLFDEQDRDRGPALVELSELYKATGFEISDGELPDYLPLILEYVASMQDKNSARQFLQQTAQATDIIASNLENCASPYAPLVRLVENHGRVSDIAA